MDGMPAPKGRNVGMVGAGLAPALAKVTDHAP